MDNLFKEVVLAAIINLLSTYLIALYMLLNLLTNYVLVEAFQFVFLLLLVLDHLLFSCCVCLI